MTTPLPPIDIKALPKGLYTVVPVYKGQSFPPNMMDAAYTDTEGDAFIAGNLATLVIPDFLKAQLNPKNARRVSTSALDRTDDTEQPLVLARGIWRDFRRLVHDRAAVLSASKMYADVQHRLEQLGAAVRGEMTPVRVEELKQAELKKLKASPLTSFTGTDDAAREANRQYQIQSLLERPKVLKRHVAEHVKWETQRRFAEEKGLAEHLVAGLFDMSNRTSLANARRQVIKPFFRAYQERFVPGEIRVNLGESDSTPQIKFEPRLADIIPPRRRKRPRN